jgi:hypothetical protein
MVASCVETGENGEHKGNDIKQRKHSVYLVDGFVTPEPGKREKTGYHCTLPIWNWDLERCLGESWEIQGWRDTPFGLGIVCTFWTAFGAAFAQAQ